MINVRDNAEVARKLDCHERGTMRARLRMVNPEERSTQIQKKSALTRASQVGTAHRPEWRGVICKANDNYYLEADITKCHTGETRRDWLSNLWDGKAFDQRVSAPGGNI